MKKQKKEDIIWASGRHLTTYLPDNFDKWPQDKLYSFIEDNICEQYEYWDRENVWSEICDLADSMRRHIHHEKTKKAR